MKIKFVYIITKTAYCQNTLQIEQPNYLTYIMNLPQAYL